MGDFSQKSNFQHAKFCKIVNVIELFCRYESAAKEKNNFSKNIKFNPLLFWISPVLNNYVTFTFLIHHFN